ncbi:inactive non-canonical poly(A) RNA polymerase protein Trf4-2 [Drosophila innubila]|uniref:inactive non-canonical poly(A) RNA polymerase protein Trf4-2 n=1 Tax=Drosophila innubila TaxID=198719 RepID=UPI00148E7743|nr:inactive non-canonical poly(A) RNA polymerase protein Trf4-2 [Drosophila innubila]XP_034486978.1 inactive non-canonical poly(A) RNA polymerase protein Trf4-2 [Drosophila innubila]
MSITTSEQEPWLLNNFEYGSGLLALHREIDHFYNYITSTPTEYMMRMEAVYRIENVVLHTWPEACIEVFGSFSTGLNLPISDIDIAVDNIYWQGEPLVQLKNALIARGVADQVNVLDKASVPVVKFTDRISQVKFDISFNTKSGVKAAELVKRFIKQFPELPKLVMVLKQFLMLQGLNEVYSSGGISSYAITLMCVSFLQQQTLENTSSKNNRLGRLLLKFLDYYGRKFDYFKYGISVRDNAGCVEKSELQNSFGYDSWLSVLTIEDPITPTNDIGRSSYGALDVKQCFEMAFLKLSKVVDLDPSKVSGSLLATIITVPQSVIKYRNWVHYNFRHLAINGYGRHYEYQAKKSDDKKEPEKETASNVNGLTAAHKGCQNTKA